MRRFQDLSFRHKIPLRASALAIITAIAVTASLIAREYEESRDDLLEESRNLVRILAFALVAPMQHDETWRAFEIVRGPFDSHTGEPDAAADLVLVLDTSQRVYVSTNPRQYPVLSDPAQIDPEYAALRQSIAAAQGREPIPVEPSGSRRTYMVAPIMSDNVLLGTVVMRYQSAAFLPHLYDIAGDAVLGTLVVLAVLLPASWYWGQRMAAPLIELADGMGKVGTLPATEIRQDFTYTSRDEIGQAGDAFQRMLGELRQKEALEQEVMASERLAAVGRLAAGIAHEINNPLGGMLNVISNLRKSGSDGAVSARTVCLLDNGLQQIRNTVAALLVEAKVENRSLSRQDIDDTHMLALASGGKEGLTFAWQNDVFATLPLPATLVRQILINLQLNAIQATGSPGHVSCRVGCGDGRLVIDIENDGRHIEPEQMKVLFEPFTHFREKGTGLGLWVTYQIVSQLHGDINADSKPGSTRFTVILPFGGTR